MAEETCSRRPQRRLRLAFLRSVAVAAACFAAALVPAAFAQAPGATILLRDAGSGAWTPLEQSVVSDRIDLSLLASVESKRVEFHVDDPSFLGAPADVSSHRPRGSGRLTEDEVVSLDTSRLRDGLHVLSARAFDEDGLEAVGHAVFRVDNGRGLGAGVRHHVLVTGQSLANGGGPPISTSQPFLNAMFSAGQSAAPPVGRAGFAPLVSVNAESIAAGAANQATLDAMRAEIARLSAGGSGAPLRPRLGREPGAPARRPRLLVSRNAHGGSRLSEIDLRGGDPYGVYAKGIAQARAAREAATAAGERYEVAAVFFLQGERDRFDATDDWRQRLIDLKDDYNRDLRAAADQARRIPLLTYQTASTPAISTEPDAASRIPLLQLAAAEADREVFLVAPTYFLQHADELHLTAHGYRRLGAYFGRVLERVALRGVEWRPLMPLSVTTRASDVRIAMHVPVPPLVFDTESLPPARDHGFRLRTPAGDEIPIERVSIENGDTVVIRAAGSLPQGARVTYARDVDSPPEPFVGGHGNLRDSDPGASWARDEAGEPYPLYNWAVVFDLAVGYDVTRSAAPLRRPVGAGGSTEAEGPPTRARPRSSP